MKIYAVFRQYGCGNVRYAQFHFYKAFESRNDAKAFCEKKNSNNGSSYLYRVKSLTVIADSKNAKAI